MGFALGLVGEIALLFQTTQKSLYRCIGDSAFGGQRFAHLLHSSTAELPDQSENLGFGWTQGRQVFFSHNDLLLRVYEIIIVHLYNTSTEKNLLIVLKFLQSSQLWKDQLLPPPF